MCCGSTEATPVREYVRSLSSAPPSRWKKRFDRRYGWQIEPLRVFCLSIFDVTELCPCLSICFLGGSKDCASWRVKKKKELNARKRKNSLSNCSLHQCIPSVDTVRFVPCYLSGAIQHVRLMIGWGNNNPKWHTHTHTLISLCQNATDECAIQWNSHSHIWQSIYIAHGVFKLIPIHYPSNESRCILTRVVLDPTWKQIPVENISKLLLSELCL